MDKLISDPAVQNAPPPFEGFDPSRELQRIIRLCARRTKKDLCGRPRWSIVGEITGHGSGYSIALCKWAGVDPHEKCIRNWRLPA